MWKTLCPFWGEEYQVHLPPAFHAVAFYVMDEDALRWVGPHSLAGAQTPPPAHFTAGTAGRFASPLQPGGRGSPEGSGRDRGLSVWVSVGAEGSLGSHHIVRVRVRGHRHGCAGPRVGAAS